MSARDELARAIFLADNSGAPAGLMEAEWDQGMHGPDSYAHNIADGLLAAGYRKVVTKPAEIPVLPGQITVDTVLERRSAKRVPELDYDINGERFA